MTNASGALLSQQRYLPFGGERTNLGTIYPSGHASQTDYGYTGQRDLNMGLMDYKARFYSPILGRFTQPDTITPGGPQGLNRYSYVANNPINLNDPSGHKWTCTGANDDHCSDDGKGKKSGMIDRRSKNYDDGGGRSVGDIIGLDKNSDLACIVNSCTINVPGTCPIGETCYLATPPGFLDNPSFWSTTSTTTQDMATMMSITGAAVEIGATISGCIAGSTIAGVGGCAAGYLEGRAFHAFVTNPLEQTLGLVSFGSTLRANYLIDNLASDSTITALATWGAGQTTSEPIADAIIDIYASGYNHGYFCGFTTILTCSP